MVGLIILAIHGCPSNAQISQVGVGEGELKALNQSIAEGHIGSGIDRLSAFRQKIDPDKDPDAYWTISRQLLDLFFQLEDTARAEQVIKSIVQSQKIGASRPAIFQWTQFYIGEWLYVTGHGTEGEKFLRALTDGDGRWVLIPAQRAAAVLLSKIELPARASISFQSASLDATRSHWRL